MGVVGEATQVGDVGDRKLGTTEEGNGRVDPAFEDKCGQTVPVGTEPALQRATGQAPLLGRLGECPAGSGLIGDAPANVDGE